MLTSVLYNSSDITKKIIFLALCPILNGVAVYLGLVVAPEL